MPNLNRFAGVDLSQVSHVVSPSSLQSGLVTVLGATAATVAGSVTLFGFLSKGQLAEAASWVQSAGGLVYLTALITLVSLGGLFARTFFRNEKTKDIAEASPNAIVATAAEAKELGVTP